MLIYNQCPYRSLSNLSPLEAYHGKNTLDIFLKKYCNEGQVKKKKFSVNDTVRINQTWNIEKGNYLWSTYFFKVSTVFDTIPVTYRLRDMKNEEIPGSFYDYELQKVNSMEYFKLKIY